MKKLAMKMLSLLLVLSLLLPTCVFAQPGQDGDGEPGTQSTTSEETTTFTEGGNGDGNADTSTGGGNGGGDADTSTGGGNSGENADTSTEGGNGDETSKDGNGGGNSDETSKDENGGGNGDTPTEEPIMATVSIAVAAEDDDDDFSQEELLEGYLYSISGLYGEGAAVFRAPSKPLPVETHQVYDELQPMVLGVANGTGTTTEFAITKTWTKDRGASGWGIPDGDTIFTTNAEGKTVLTDAASEAIGKFLDVDALMQRMLSTMPYELYWFDKTGGHGMQVTYGASLSGSNLTVSGLKISMWVAQTYATHNGDGTYKPFTPNTTVTSAASTAVDNAKKIVTDNSSKSDYEKLKAYLSEICNRVDYNHAAAAGSSWSGGYGDPWQLIYVFDNDATTNVVCEGYAKAFKYLCDLSAFSEYLSCYLVTGNMTGGTGEGGSGAGGGHMWNVVHIGGNNYLVDVTNCDTGTIGATDKLFLCGVEDQTNGESYRVTIGSSVISFSYDAATKEYYTKDELTLSAVKYEEPAMPALGGTVTITGASSPNPKIGETLTANTGSLDYNGATAGTLSYRWKAGGVDVGTGNTYTVKVGDYNKKITVTVTSSSNTGSVSSAETAAVVKKDNTTVPTAPVVKDATAEGFTYTAIAGQQYAITTNNIAPVTDSSEWKTETAGDVVVTGKNANTEYYVYTRYAETEDTYAGAASGGTKVKTRMSAAASQFNYTTKEAVYTGSANGATVSSTVHNGQFELRYDGESTVPTKVGTYALTAVVTAHDDYAATTVELGTWEIKPLEVTLTWNNIADRTYDGNNSNVTAIVSNKAIAADEVNVTVTGGTEANAGSHTATAAALTGAAASNYKLPDTKPTQAYIINAATITVTGAFTSYTGVYDGNPHSITVDRSKIETKGGQEFTIEYSADGGSTYGAALPEITNVNESPKTVHYKITAPNHADQTGTATITINQAAQTISGGNFSVKVGKTVNLDDKFSAQGALTYSITGANTTGSSVSGGVLTVGTTTGSFTLRVDAATTGNYNAATKNVTVTVTAKEVQTITAGDVSATYGDTNVKVMGSTNGDGAITYAVTGGTDVVDVNSSTGALTIKKAGTATVTISAAETSDYAKATKSVTINVAQKDVTITGLSAANKVYDGNTTATVTGTAAVAGKVGSDDVTVTVGTATFDNENVGAGKTVTFSGYGLGGAAAGNYNLTAQPANVTAEITAREVTITNGITATNRPYEKNNTTVNLNKSTLTFTNLVAGETLDANVPTTGTVDNANVGTGKNVTYSGVTLINGTGMASNYKLVGLPTVTVDITQAAAPAAPTGLNGVKGNALSTVALPAGWTWVNGSTVMNTIGSQTFKANYIDAAGNYASATNVNVTVNVMDKTDVSGKISFNDGTLVYTGAGQRYETASISGITAGMGVTWTYAYTAGTGTLDGGLPKTVGTYTVTVTYEDSLNYGTKSVTLTITQATPTGAPKFTKITSSGKTLADAALVKTVSGSGDGFSVAGTVEWVDGSGTALADSTSVEANKSYGWKFTPTDSNYKSISGSVVVYTVRRVSHSGGAAADSAAAAAAQPTVYSGSRGESVKTLQEKLNAKGFNAGSVDGIFGKNTREAVMAFQKANGLAADGIVGKLTWAKLYDTTAALPAASTATGTQPMVYRGSRGDAVRRLQELLNKKGFDCGAVDGIFGSKTYAAVMAFQKANGLSADGIVGPLTWGKLG